MPPTHAITLFHHRNAKLSQFIPVGWACQWCIHSRQVSPSASALRLPAFILSHMPDMADILTLILTTTALHQGSLTSDFFDQVPLYRHSTRGRSHSYNTTQLYHFLPRSHLRGLSPKNEHPGIYAHSAGAETRPSLSATSVPAAFRVPTHPAAGCSYSTLRLRLWLQTTSFQTRHRV